MEKCKISVMMNPQPHINKNKPYYWAILDYSESKEDWFTLYCGWSESPEKAFVEAKQLYDKVINELAVLEEM